VEEVIVTANKKVETVQEIPMNISVITDVDIEERGITTPEDFLRTLAGVTTPGGSRYYSFRGLNTSSAQRSSGTTSTYIDEIPGTTMNIWDIDRIEVLRGPQGTLYGSNAIGGTIRYITKKPDLSGFDYAYSVEYGKKRFAGNAIVNYNAMVNIPLNDLFALRATYSQALDPGIYENIITQNKDVGDQDDERYTITLGFERDDSPIHDGNIKSMIRYIVSDRYDEGMKEKGNGDKPGTADINDPNCNTSTAFYYGSSCTRLTALAAEYGRDLSDYHPLFSFAEVTDEVHNVVMSTLASTTQVGFDWGSATLTTMYRDYDEDSETEWSRIDTDDLYPAPLIVTSDSETDITELRLSSNPGMIEWTVGLYDFEANSDPNSIVENQALLTAEAWDYIQFMVPGGYDGAAYCPPYCGDDASPYFYYGSYTYYNYSEEKAMYGEVALNLDKWKFTAGLRDYEISDGYKTSEFGIFYSGNGCDGTATEGTTCNEESGTEADTRPKLTATYMPNEDLTLFAVSSAGYRPGGNNTALPPFCANDPEASNFQRRYTSDKAENTEFGLKARGDSFSFNATYFMIDWTDIQIGIAPACGWSFSANGGEAETKGFEIDFDVELAEGLYMDFAGSFMTAETTIDMPSFGASAGDSLPGTVEEQYNVGFSYDYAAGSKPAYARLDYLYYGESYATFGQSEDQMSPAYEKFNLNWGVELNENSTLQLSIDNLMDNRTEAFKFSADSPGYRPRNYLQWIPPRSVSLRYTYRY
jgi:outer membrane receptor protein involved in Fe transport